VPVDHGQQQTPGTFSSSGVDTLPSSPKASDANAFQGLNPADPVLTPAVDTPTQDELIRNLIALVKEEPGTGPFTLAITALLKTDAVQLLLAEAGVSVPLVTSTSGRQQ